MSASEAMASAATRDFIAEPHLGKSWLLQSLTQRLACLPPMGRSRTATSQHARGQMAFNAMAQGRS